jgi:hypothetical protein
MSNDLPRPDISRFSPILPETVILAYLGLAKRALSPSTLKSRLRVFVEPAVVEKALADLIADGKASAEGSVVLTKFGGEHSKSILGRDVGQDWEKIWRRRLPLLALGLDPDHTDTRLQFARTDSLICAAIAVSFALSTKNVTSKCRLQRACLAGPESGAFRPGWSTAVADY